MYDNLTGCRVVVVDHLSRMHTIHVILTGLSSESQKVRAARSETTLHGIIPVNINRGNQRTQQ